MVKALKSEYGEGTGGPCQVTDDPNRPTFDAAEKRDSTDAKIEFLVSPHTIEELSDWERQFVMDVYGQRPLTRKQHMKVASIYKKHTQPKLTP